MRPPSRFSSLPWMALLAVAALTLGTPPVGAPPAAANHLPYVVGEVFAGDSSGIIKRYSPTGVFVEDLDTTTNSSFETGMCFGESGNLRSTNFSDGSVTLFNNQGGVIDATWVSGLNASPESCVLDAAGDVYVGTADGLRDIYKFDAAGNQLAQYDPVTGPRGTDWIDLAADQCTMYYTSEGSDIRRFDVCSNTQLSNFATGFTTGATDCYALRIRLNGEVMVACSDQVYRLSPTGTVIQTYPASTYGESFFFALNLDPDGVSFWTAGLVSGDVYRVNIDTGLLLTTFNAAPNGVFGLAIFGEITAARPPANLTLSPKADENPVGTEHCVTATVTDTQGDPAEDVVVRFSVSGTAGNSASGSATTDASGQAEFCYTGPSSAGIDAIQAYADADEDNVQDPGEPFDVAEKTWVGGEPATLTLDPLAATNPVDSEHCVTATVLDATGNPVSDVTVRFMVTGSVSTSGSATTDADGEAEFCYDGPALPGADAIHAFADTDEDNVQDPGEPFGDAEKTWVLPVTTPGCEIKITNGGWIIAMNLDRASFGGVAMADADGNVSGNEEYQDHGPVEPFNLHGNVLVVVCDATGTAATIFGQASIDGSGSFTYRIDVKDLGEPGRGNDTYRMRVNAYDSGEQILRGGNVQIQTS